MLFTLIILSSNSVNNRLRNKMEQYKGKIVMVTGASSGIGESISITLAEKGLIVIALARRVEKIQEYAKTTDGTIYPLKCDLMNKEDIHKAFRFVEDEFGGVDVLVNNAGYLPTCGMTDGSIEELERTLNTNVLSYTICAYEALKTMRNRGDNGHIINVNSVAGHRIHVMDKAGIYFVSKHAVTVFSETLRNELRLKKSHIKVTNLSPGLVHTEMAAKGIKVFTNEDLPPVEECGSKSLYSQDLADMVVFLLSVKPHIEIQQLTLESTEKIY